MDMFPFSSCSTFLSHILFKAQHHSFLIHDSVVSCIALHHSLSFIHTYSWSVFIMVVLRTVAALLATAAVSMAIPLQTLQMFSIPGPLAMHFGNKVVPQDTDVTRKSCQKAISALVRRHMIN